MKNVIRKSIGALIAAATLATVATPAEARRWRHHRGDNDAALAIGAGIIGLGIGAALASDRRYYDRYYDPYYDRGYYNRGYYHGGYYDRGYYAPRYRSGYYHRYGRDCFTRRVYDPYIGRRVKVRYCR